MQVMLIIGFIVAVMVPLYLLTMLSLPLLVLFSLVLSLVLLFCLQVMVERWRKQRPGDIFWSVEQPQSGCGHKIEGISADTLALPCCEICACPDIVRLDSDPTDGPEAIDPASQDSSVGLCSRCGHRGSISPDRH